MSDFLNTDTAGGSLGGSNNRTVQPQYRLELSVCQDGSLLTAPLSAILNAATETLYKDLKDMTYNEVTIAIPAAGPAIGAATVTGPSASAVTTDGGPQQDTSTKNGKMSSLSFLERRVRLSSYLARHSKSISHIAALVASYLPQSASQSSPQFTNTMTGSRRSYKSSVVSTSHYNQSSIPKEFELTEITQLASNALMHVHKTWVHADEAQDALYLYHGKLWQSRRHPHDVFGAMTVFLNRDDDDNSRAQDDDNKCDDGDAVMKQRDELTSKRTTASSNITRRCWTDLPRDINVTLDPYTTSEERKYSKAETLKRLQSVVRRKLVMGEVALGYKDRKQGLGTGMESFQWDMMLEQKGTVLRLTYGEPYHINVTSTNSSTDPSSNVGDTQKVVYPIEARVTVLSEQSETQNQIIDDKNKQKIAPWTLLSIHVRTCPKTGESNHQLELSSEQMYHFHRLCAASMNQEEQKNNNSDSTGGTPLARLLKMSHIFSISWQMDILSCQADALRKGSWSASTGSIGKGKAGVLEGSGIEVTPVQFLSDYNDNDDELKPLAIMAIHFWAVDDRHGSPKMGDLIFVSNEKKNDKENNITSLNKSIESAKDHYSNKKGLPRRFTLEIRAVPQVGLEVSLSGGNLVMELLQQQQQQGQNDKNNTQRKHLDRSLKKLLSSLKDPFQLSISDALLSATVICAERRCQAVVDALQKAQRQQSLTNKVLPSWLHVSVECGSISIAASLSYEQGQENSSISDDTQSKRPKVLLFRLACDSRTGRYVASFPRMTSLLRELACNSETASEAQFIRNVRSIEINSASGKRAGNIGTNLTGNIVRNAFDSLTRSMDNLGRKVGLGDDWDNMNKDVSALREKTIFQGCMDVRISLMTCAGMAAVFGLGASAVSISGGANAQVDIGGGPVEDEKMSSLKVPPLAIITHQQLVEHTHLNRNNEDETVMRLERELFGITASVSDDKLMLQLLDITTRLESPYSLPERTSCSIIPLLTEHSMATNAELNRPTKRIRLESNEDIGDGEFLSDEKKFPVFEEIKYLATCLKETWKQIYE